MKYVLCINASGSGVSLGLFGKKLSFIAHDPQMTSENLPKYIFDVLILNLASYAEIYSIVIVRGPGSTIGIRASIAIAESHALIFPNTILMAPDIFDIIEMMYQSALAIVAVGRDKYLYKVLSGVHSNLAQWIESYSSAIKDESDDLLIFEAVTKDILELEIYKDRNNKFYNINHFVYVANGSSADIPDLGEKLNLQDQQSFMKILSKIVLRHFDRDLE